MGEKLRHTPTAPDADAVVAIHAAELLKKQAEEDAAEEAIPKLGPKDPAAVAKRVTQAASDKDAKRKGYATIRHPNIEAVTEALFRLESIDQAKERLNSISDYFIISKDQPDPEEGVQPLKLWIKGYGLTPEDEAKGFLGHYAIVRAVRLDNGVYTLTAEKVVMAPRFHPQRVRPKRKHPDWGHPILRKIRKGITFATVEEGQTMLQDLHQQFPEVTIPNANKLFCIIYQKREDASKPVQKFVFTIEVLSEGGYTIQWRENSYKPSAKPPTPPKPSISVGATTNDGPVEPAGYFSSKVLLKRKSKR